MKLASKQQYFRVELSAEHGNKRRSL